jgi:hypothetical protein
MDDRGSVPRFSTVRSNKPSDKARVKGETLDEARRGKEYDEFVKAVDPGYRIDRRLSLAIPLPRAKAVGLKISRQDIPLSLLPDLRSAAIYRVARNGCRDIDLGMSP